MQTAAGMNVNGRVNPFSMWSGRHVTMEQLQRTRPHWIVAELVFTRGTASAVVRASFRFPSADHDILVTGIVTNTNLMAISLYNSKGGLQDDEIPCWTMSGVSALNRKPHFLDAPILIPARTPLRLEALNDVSIRRAKIVFQGIWIDRSKKL